MIGTIFSVIYVMSMLLMYAMWRIYHSKQGWDYTRADRAFGLFLALFGPASILLCGIFTLVDFIQDHWPDQEWWRQKVSW